MKTQKYLNIVSHYEACLEKHGDSHLGVDWPNQADALTRYRVMLEVVRAQEPATVSLLDFGCGASHLYDYMLENGIRNIDYSGLDLSEKFVQLSRQKHPAVNYYCIDILKDSSSLPQFDYIVMNGVFTEKRELSHEEMWDYFRQMILKAFEHTRVGMAFNVMSAHVDWERDDLFHLPIDKLSSFLVKNVSRDFVVRHDYKLYEYTTYIYRR